MAAGSGLSTPAAALWQFGGYGQNNGVNGAYQIQAGADIPNLANGTLSST